MACLPPSPVPPPPPPPPIFLPFNSPTPTTQQGTQLNFLQNSWCTSQDTSVTVTGTDSLKITGNKIDSEYNTWKTRGFAPFILMKPNSSTFEFSCKITLELNYIPNLKCIGGIMLLDQSYNPLFECGIGIDNTDPYIVSSGQSPVSPVLEQGYGDSFMPDYLNTVFQSHYGESVTYTSSVIDINSEIPVKIKFNQSTNTLEYFDGFSNHQTTTLFSVSYVALFMRGYGKNTIYFKNILYNGFLDQIPPSKKQIDNLILEKTTLNDNFKIISGNSDFSNCEIVCELNPSCRGFIHDSDSGLCSTQSYIDTENIFDSKQQESISPVSPISPVYEKVSSNIYIPNNKIQLISGFFIFNDKTTNQRSTLVINSDTSLVSICIDNNEKEDFIATSNKGDVYISSFGYDILKHPITQNGALALKLQIQNTVFYIVSKNTMKFKDVIFISNDKTTIIDPAKEIVNSNFNLLGSDLSSRFDHFNILFTSSSPSFFRTSSNSFTISNSLPKRLTSYTINGTSFSTSSPVNSLAKISPCKIIFHSTRLMMLAPGMLYLLNDNSIFAPTLTKGTMFTNIASVTSVESAFTATLATPIPPDFSIPSSIDFPANYLNGGIFKFIDNTTTYVLKFSNGNRLTYYSLGYSFTYVISKITGGGVIFTDKGGMRHLLYIDPTDLRIYDMHGNGDVILGPFEKCIAPEMIGDSYVFSEKKPNGKYKVQRITLTTFNYATIIEYDEAPNPDSVWLESYYKNFPTIIRIRRIAGITVIFDYDYVTKNSFLLGYLDKSTNNYINLIMKVSNDSEQLLHKTIISDDQFFQFKTSSMPVPDSSETGLKCELGKLFAVYLIPLLNSNFSSAFAFNIGNTCDQFDSGDLQNKGTPIRSGTYTLVQNKQNLYESTVTDTFSDGVVKTFIYNKYTPYVITDTNTNISYQASFIKFNIRPSFIPLIQDLGKVSITPIDNKNIRVNLENPNIEEGEPILLDLALGDGTIHIPQRFTNAPSVWSSALTSFVLTTQFSMQYGTEYMLILRLPELPYSLSKYIRFTITSAWFVGRRYERPSREFIRFISSTQLETNHFFGIGVAAGTYSFTYTPTSSTLTITGGTITQTFLYNSDNDTIEGGFGIYYSYVQNPTVNPQSPAARSPTILDKLVGKKYSYTFISGTSRDVIFNFLTSSTFKFCYDPAGPSQMTDTGTYSINQIGNIVLTHTAASLGTTTFVYDSINDGIKTVFNTGFGVAQNTIFTEYQGSLCT